MMLFSFFKDGILGKKLIFELLHRNSILTIFAFYIDAPEKKQNSTAVVLKKSITRYIYVMKIEFLDDINAGGKF